MTFCEYCRCEVKNITNHNKTKKHLLNVGEKVEEQSTSSTKDLNGPSMDVDEIIEKVKSESESENTDNEEDCGVSVYSVYDEEFLKDLENEAFDKPAPDVNPEDITKKIKQMRQENALKKEELKQRRLEEIERKKLMKASKMSEEVDEGEVETELLGKEKRIILKKIQLFKNCFKQELKNTRFKVSKHASVAELEQLLEEMQVIVNVNSVEEFAMDIIYGSLKVIEGASSFTRDFDITGLADTLKHNDQFVKLCKLMFIKYQTFEMIPPEYQILFIVLINAVIMAQMNKAKKLGQVA